MAPITPPTIAPVFDLLSLSSSDEPILTHFYPYNSYYSSHSNTQ